MANINRNFKACLNYWRRQKPKWDLFQIHRAAMGLGQASIHDYVAKRFQLPTFEDFNTRGLAFLYEPYMEHAKVIDKWLK